MLVQEYSNCNHRKYLVRGILGYMYTGCLRYASMKDGENTYYATDIGVSIYPILTIIFI